MNKLYYAKLIELMENFKTCPDQYYRWFNDDEEELNVLYPVLESLGYTFYRIGDFEKKWYHSIFPLYTRINLAEPYNKVRGKFSSDPNPQTKNYISVDYHDVILTQKELITYKNHLKKNTTERIVDFLHKNSNDKNLKTADFEINFKLQNEEREVTIYSPDYWTLSHFQNVIFYKMAELQIRKLGLPIRSLFSGQYYLELIMKHN